MSNAEEHGHGIPDEVIVVGFAGAMASLIAVLVGLALLTNMWAVQATPDMREVHEPPPVLHH